MPGQPQTHGIPEGYLATLRGRQVTIPFLCPPRCCSYRVEQLVCRRPDPRTMELRLRPGLRVLFSLAHGLGGAVLLAVCVILCFVAPWGRLTSRDLLFLVVVGGAFLAVGVWRLFASLDYLGDWGRVVVDLAKGTARAGYRPWSGFRWQILLSGVLALDLVQYQTNGLPVLPFQVNPDPRGSRWVVSLILDGPRVSSWGLTWSGDREEAQAAGRQLASALGLPFVDQMSVKPLPG